jgi:sugar lactone lactonase YvrE
MLKAHLRLQRGENIMGWNRKRTAHIVLILGSLSLLLLLTSRAGEAMGGDTVADRVLGQSVLTTSTPYFVDGRIFSATDVAIDRSVTPNRIYLADAELNRVLGWSDINRFAAKEAADLVLGQPTLFMGEAVFAARNCPAPPSATRFCRPNRVAVDPRGNVYVGDLFNFRVLEFDRPFTTDRVADRVFGQPDFTSRQYAGLEPASPSDTFQGIGIDAVGNVWMVDPTGARRVLELDDPLTHDTQPDRVIESETVAECLSRSPDERLCRPADVEISPLGDLYVQDFGINSARRLLIYRQPLTTDLIPDVLRFWGDLGGLAFDAAGNLLTTIGVWIQRYPAAFGPDTQPDLLAGPFRTDIAGRGDVDSAGNLYVTGRAWPESGNDRVLIFQPPYQREPFKIGRTTLVDQGLRRPTLVAVDRSSSPNHLYAADGDDRILGWRDAAGFDNGAPPDLVIDGNDPKWPGTCDYAGAAVNASRFCLIEPNLLGGLAVDSRGNLWLSDVFNNRILEFNRPFDTDGVADRVLGQGNSFTTRTCNKGGRSARSLCNPGALAFDRNDNLFVADQLNHRVLLFVQPLKDKVADRVFGQADFRKGQCNRGNAFQPRADTLCFGFEDGAINVYQYMASGLAVDPQGTLYVGDSFNSRVLIFQDAVRSDARPDAVLGQDGNFESRLAGTGAKRFGGVRFEDTPTTFGPSGLAIGPAGELYVADSPNDRLLVFADPLRNDVADRVFGHEDFAAGGSPSLQTLDHPPASATRLLRPTALAFDVHGNLYVADAFYNRVLAFDTP